MATRVVFDHERLQVYQLGIDLVEAVDGFAPNFTGVRRHLARQLHRAATSVPLNIAEGNGRFRNNDKAQLLVVATASALECAAILDIAERLGVGSGHARAEIRELLENLVPMLIALTRSVRTRRRNPES